MMGKCPLKRSSIAQMTIARASTDVFGQKSWSLGCPYWKSKIAVLISRILFPCLLVLETPDLDERMDINAVAIKKHLEKAGFYVETADRVYALVQIQIWQVQKRHYPFQISEFTKKFLTIEPRTPAMIPDHVH